MRTASEAEDPAVRRPIRTMPGDSGRILDQPEPVFIGRPAGVVQVGEDPLSPVLDLLDRLSGLPGEPAVADAHSCPWALKLDQCPMDAG